MVASSKVLPVPELSFVGKDTARQRTKILPACSQPLAHMAVSVFVPYVRLSRLCCSVLCSEVVSIPFPFLAMRQPARAALRAASSCSSSPAVLQPAGRLSVKQAAPCVSFSDSLFCVQAGLRPASNASRYAGSAVPRGEGQRHSCTASKHVTSFCLLDSVKIGRRNPLQDLTPLPIRAVSLLWLSPPLVQSYIYMDSCQWSCGISRHFDVNKIGWSPGLCTWRAPPLHRAPLHKQTSTIKSTDRSANVRML